MSTVEEVQAAIDKMTAQRTASLMMPDFYEGLSTIAEWRASCELIVTLHRTIDAQLAILQEVIELYPIWVEADRESDLWATHAAHPLALARAINGGTQ